MKLKSNSKGYALSPFIIIITMILGAIFIQHFMVIDTPKAEMIAKEGGITKQLMKNEGYETAVNSATLYVANDAAYEYTQDPDRYPTPADLQTFLENEIRTKVDDTDPRIAGISSVEVDGYVERSYKTFKPSYDEGFIVRVEGNVWKGGKPTPDLLATERMIGARIFALQIYSNDLNSKYTSSQFHSYVKSLIAQRMEKLLSGVRCSRYYFYDQKIYGVRCQSNRYTSTQTKYNKFCTHRPDPMHYTTYCWEDHEVPDFMRNAKETLEKINISLIDVQRIIANEDSNIVKVLKENDMTLILDVKKISAETTVSCTEDYRCTDQAPNGGCNRHERDYKMSVKTTGEIHVEETLIDRGAIKENDTIPGKFEVCYKSPVMIKTGELKPLELKKIYVIPFEISVDYRLDCPPDYLRVDTTYSNYYGRYVKTCVPVTSKAEMKNLMQFDFNQESLTFKLKATECESGSDYDYTNDDKVLPDNNGDYLEIVPQSCGPLD